MVNYPASIDNSLSLPAAVDGSSTVSASIVNRLRTTIIDIQTELGVQPSGVYTNVKTRLDTIEGIVGDFQAIELAGDLGGTISVPLVTGLQGNPISPTAPTTDQTLVWNGSVWAPATLSGGGSGTFTAGGDLSGTDSSQTVIKINGATVPAAGSLTTGHVLKVSSASANTYGYILDANIDAAAEIAVSKLEASGTDGYALITVLGIPTWTASSSGTPGGADTQLQFNDGGALNGDAGLVYNKTTNLLTLSDALAVGIDPASAGIIRVPYDGSSRIIIAERNAADTDDYNVIATNAGSTIFGDVDTTTSMSGYTLALSAGAGGQIDTAINSGYGWFLTSAGFHVAVPILGDTRASSPLGVHGVGTQAMGDADQAPVAAVYKYNTIITTDALTADRTLTLPVATDAAAYTKIIDNTCTGGFNVIVSDGVGTTVSIPDGVRNTVLVDSRGVTKISSSSAGAGTFTAGGDLTGTVSSQQVVTLTGTGGVVASDVDISVGATPASIGAVRLPNNTGIYFRDYTDADNVPAISVGGANQIVIGGNSVYVAYIANRAPTHYFQDSAGTTDRLVITNALNSFTNPVAISATPATTGALRLPIEGMITSRNTGDTADNTLIGSTGAGDELAVWGTGGTYGHSRFYIGSGANMYMSTASVDALILNGTSATFGVATMNLASTDTIQNGNVNGGVKDVIRSLITISDTIADIYTWTIQTGAVTTVDLLITAITNDGTLGGSYKRTVTFRESAGVNLISTVHDNQSDEDAAGWDVTIDDDGAGLGRIRVTGDAVLGVTWFLSGRLQHTLLTP